MIRGLFFLFMSLLVSCGESPLLNHKIEKAFRMTDTSLSESEVLTFKKLSHSFIISWQLGPQMGESRFLIKSWKNDLGTMNGPYQDFTKNLHVFLWMPAMGHGSVPVKIKKVADGEYEVSNVQFIMGGKWEIKFQLKQDGQVLDEVVVPLTL